MRYMARLLGVHVSTISRAVRNKHVSTPLGILPLRFFLEEYSTKNRAARNRKLLKLDSELTDAHITLVLKSAGIQISRRTVNKYRRMLETLENNQEDKTTSSTGG